MKGKCLECENYYLQMRYRFLVPSGKGRAVDIHGCQSPDVMTMYAPAGHPFVLDAKGDDIEVMECNSFFPKKEDKP